MISKHFLAKINFFARMIKWKHFSDCQHNLLLVTYTTL